MGEGLSTIPGAEHLPLADYFILWCNYHGQEAWLYIIGGGVADLLGAEAETFLEAQAV